MSGDEPGIPALDKVEKRTIFSASIEYDMQTKPQKIDPYKIIEIIALRRWILIIPFCLVMVVGIGLSLTLPKQYMARTLILVVPQRVPTNFVQSIVSSDINTRINTISQQIMSRTNIEKIISEYSLYSDDDSENMFFEDKLQDMRKRIGVDVTRASRGAQAFAISFSGAEPEKVANIANKLASYFIDENLKVREAQAMGTSNFLDDELNIMRVRLENVEQKLKTYRIKHMGELPEQLDSNLRILDRLQENSGQVNESIRSAKLRLQVLSGQAPRIVSQVYSEGARQRLDQTVDQLGILTAELEELESKYTALHPDVIRLKGKIDKLKKKAAGKPTQPPNTGGTAGARPVDQDLEQAQQHEITGLKSEIKRLEEQKREIEARVSEYQKRVEATPHREQELMSLRRDYQNIQDAYNGLLNRKLESELAVNMEKKQKGERFRIVDIAKKPEKPTSPNMRKLFLLTVAAGLGIGGGIIFLLENLNASFKSADSIETQLGLPVIATLPELVSPRAKLFRKLDLACSAIGLVVCMGLFLLMAALSFVGEKEIMEAVMRIRTLSL